MRLLIFTVADNLPERVAEALRFDEDAFIEFMQTGMPDAPSAHTAALWFHARTAKLTALMPEMTGLLKRVLGDHDWTECDDTIETGRLLELMLARIEQALGDK